MKQHWLDEMDGLIIEGDILDGLEQLEDESVEAIVTDPPYELNFMGKSWDNAGVSFRAAPWRACLRVLKPGGHLVVFGGTRTHHRMWVAVEDAGFEVREMLLWMYGQGFPKSHNVSAAIDRKLLGKGPRGHAIATAGTTQVSTGKSLPSGDNLPSYQAESEAAQKFDGWGTALKPACEPILLARKPLSERTVADNVLKHGTGALNIDATRISTEGEIIHTPQSDPGKREGVVGSDLGFSKGSKTKMAAAQKESVARANELGRWPANVMIQCTCDDPQPVPEKVRQRRGEPSQTRRYDKEGSTNFAAKPGTRREGGGFVHEPDCPAGMLDAQSGLSQSSGKINRWTGGAKPFGGGAGLPYESVPGHVDFGGASRFFYCPKATKKERGADNTHPTVKPLALMRYLVRLVTPPDGVVLDPFCGSGSTLIAATEEGFGFIGVDVSPEYCELAQQRLKGRNA